MSKVSELEPEIVEPPGVIPSLTGTPLVFQTYVSEPEPAACTVMATVVPALVVTFAAGVTMYGSLNVNVAAELEAEAELLSVTVTAYPGELAASLEIRLLIVKVVVVVPLAPTGVTCARPPRSPSLMFAPSFFH